VSARTAERTELLEIDPVRLRSIVQNDPELGEFLLRVFVRRRVALISRAMGDVVLTGGHPFTYLEVEQDPAVEELLNCFNIGADHIPVAIRRPVCGAQFEQCGNSRMSRLQP
jgi:thioredoxin reductase (NADPH)